MASEMEETNLIQGAKQPVKQNYISLSWKHADVVPMPKQKPVPKVKKHLRPILLNPILSMISEDYVADTYVKPAVWRGLILNSLRPYLNLLLRMRLLLMLHSWLESADGNGATTRAVLFDFPKAFDLIDHHVLSQKLSTYDFPESIMCWILDFLTNRRQRVKLSCDCVSEWRAVPAGVPRTV